MNEFHSISLILIGASLALSHCFLIYKQKKVFVAIEPVVATHIFFLFIFYMPLAVLPLFISWFEFTEKTVIYAFLSHISMTLGFVCAKLLPPQDNTSDSPFPNKVPTLEIIDIVPDSLICTLWFSGAGIYFILFLWLGVPVLSNNVDVARMQFSVGNGMFTWPAMIAINISSWLFLHKKKYYKAVIFGLAGCLIILMTGWRSNLVHYLVGVIVVLSFAKIRLRILASLVFLVFLILGLFGVIRAVFSGGSIYGISSSHLDSTLDAIQASLLYLTIRFGIYTRSFSTIVTYFEQSPLNGQGILMDLSFFIPGRTETIVFYLKNRFADWYGGGGLPSTMPGAFFLDFSGIGMCIMCFFAALSVQMLFKIANNKITDGTLRPLAISIILIAWVYGLQGTYFAYFLPIMMMYFFVLTILVFLVKAVCQPTPIKYTEKGSPSSIYMN